jgi:hypothetical protein
VYRIKKLKKRPRSKGLYSHRGEKKGKKIMESSGAVGQLNMKI